MPRIMVVSAYWDIFFIEPPRKLIDAIKHAQTNNFELMLAMDSNAHTDLTGDKPTNARGRVLENLIMEYPTALTEIALGKIDKNSFRQP